MVCLPEIQYHKEARYTILDADMVIVIGSSLVIYPLAGFVEEYAYQCRALIIINEGQTTLDSMANIKLAGGSTNAMLDEIYQRIIGKGGKINTETD